MHKLVPLLRNFSFRSSTHFLLQKNGVSITKNLFVAKTTWQLGTGLMFRSLRSGEGMLFLMPKKQALSLHMFCVFHSIDVLFCVSSAKGLLVVDKKPFFKPFSAYTSSELADCFLELPAGTIKGVSVGDFITFPRKIFKP